MQLEADHPGIFFSNSRPVNADKHVLPPEDMQPYGKMFVGAEGFSQITPHLLVDHHVQFVGVRSGDGTLSFVNDVLMQIPATDRPALIATGGGSANTGISELIKEPAVPIPDHLSDIFPPDRYEARYYLPPLLTYTETDRKQSIMYLFGACHMSVNGTIAQERLAASSTDTKKTYTDAGIATLRQLGEPTLTPRLISYVINGETINADHTPSQLVNLAIALPRLGMFAFNERVPANKLWLLTIRGNPVMTRLKYLATAVTGVTFRNGPEMAVRMGFVERTEVDQVTILPDQKNNRPTINIDGEISSTRGAVTISRNRDGIIYLFPKPLVADLQR